MTGMDCLGHTDTRTHTHAFSLCLSAPVSLLQISRPSPLLCAAAVTCRDFRATHRHTLRAFISTNFNQDGKVERESRSAVADSTQQNRSRTAKGTAEGGKLRGEGNTGQPSTSRAACRGGGATPPPSASPRLSLFSLCVQPVPRPSWQRPDPILKARIPLRPHMASV